MIMTAPASDNDNDDQLTEASNTNSVTHTAATGGRHWIIGLVSKLPRAEAYHHSAHE